eukprot:771848-Pyramimonas_sp.AAC.1
MGQVRRAGLASRAGPMGSMTRQGHIGFLGLARPADFGNPMGPGSPMGPRGAMSPMGRFSIMQAPWPASSESNANHLKLSRLLWIAQPPQGNRCQLFQWRLGAGAGFSFTATSKSRRQHQGLLWIGGPVGELNPSTMSEVCQGLPARVKSKPHSLAPNAQGGRRPHSRGAGGSESSGAGFGQIEGQGCDAGGQRA